MNGICNAHIATKDHRVLVLFLQQGHFVDVNIGIIRLLVVLEHTSAGVATYNPVLGGLGEGGKDLLQFLLGGGLVPHTLTT